ncbi:6-hydroxymethylpterin diphosphokinase MptE-like protein [Salarchaeum japonicum]|uniref:6-hydroxymethyl-7,8-dihydropterin pyrophosphokinase n=1 Tax=Salarchaeum japonicum TaxID=555573 RepID=A0AAV3T284_9EURY|nr:6-hydroxymethylpterin diphosphokinase MptE-like protein [Salarchaeum japonicum]
MDYDTWNSVYERVLTDFDFSREADERARDRISEYARPFDRDRLDARGDTVAVAGAGPSLSDDLDLARDADRVFAASTATDILADAGIRVDAMVTDLDKNPATARDRTLRGDPVVAHAHGDNIPAIAEWLPEFDADHVLCTTQAEPRDSVYDFGGFTDGDRAAFLADELGATELVFPGWDFDDPTVDAMKAKKLDWAERLLYWLETRRGETFDVLDGRRDGLELP